MPTAVVSSAPSVEKRRHKHLVLILAREFASNLATPTLIADDQGTLALDQRRPAHEALRITSVDGVERDVAVTAFPLFAHADEFVGIVAIFWRQ